MQIQAQQSQIEQLKQAAVESGGADLHFEVTMETLKMKPIRDYIAMSEPVRHFLAGAWFALAAVVPVAYYFLFNPLNGHDVPMFGGSINLTALVPVFISGICGSLLGAEILNPEETKNALQAIGRGLIVSLLSYLFLFSGVAAILIIAGANIVEVIVSFIVFFLYGLLIIGWLIALVGAIAGGLLYLFRLLCLRF